MRPPVPALILLIAAAGLSSGCSDPIAPGGPKYRATDLGTLPTGQFSTATDINSAGQVVGTAEIVPGSAPGASHPFLWESGVITDIADPSPLPDDYVNSATAINPAGTVVVLSSGFRHTRAWLWQQGVRTDLPVVTGFGGEDRAYDINPSGQVVGTADYVVNTYQFHAVLWENGGLTDLGTLGDTGWSIAYGVDPTGRVVGQSNGAAFLWEQGVMTDLQIAGSQAIARRINAAGQVVGSVILDGVNHGFVWQQGVTTDLGEVGEVTDINSSGQVVGWRTVAGTDHGFVWKDGVMTDLPGPSQAFGINDEGQIVGNAGLGHADSGFRPARATLWTPE